MFRSVRSLQVSSPAVPFKRLLSGGYNPYPKKVVAKKTYSSTVPVKKTTGTATGSSTTTSSATASPTTKPATSTTTTTYAATPAGSTGTAAGFDLKDSPPIPETLTSSLSAPTQTINWADSFHGIGTAPFPRESADILLAPIENDDIEIKPDGLLYLPEIKYRRILNRAFGPGGWGLVPRTESIVTAKQITREYGLICHGRLVSVARGEQDYFGGEEKIPTALEGCKSNALMRCCKDLGIASELWDPNFIRKWKAKYADEVFAEHVVTKKKKKLWKLKSIKSLDYPFKQC